MSARPVAPNTHSLWWPLLLRSETTRHWGLNSLFPKKWLQWETGLTPFPSAACMQPRCSHFRLGVSLLSKLIYLGICSKQTLGWIIYRVRIPHIPVQAAFMRRENHCCLPRNAGAPQGQGLPPAPLPVSHAPAPSKNQVLRTAGGPPRALSEGRLHSQESSGSGKQEECTLLKAFINWGLGLLLGDQRSQVFHKQSRL